MIDKSNFDQYTLEAIESLKNIDLDRISKFAKKFFNNKKINIKQDNDTETPESGFINYISLD